jgi:hypothetical protein
VILTYESSSIFYGDVLMSDIKRARQELQSIAFQMREISNRAAVLADEIVGVIDNNMYRPKPVRRAPVRSAAVTPSKRDEIKGLYQEADDLSFAEIARLANVNPGRVSEVVRDKR